MSPEHDPTWAWPREDIETHYKQGHCHVMAFALRSLTSLPMGVMWNPFDWHVEPDEDGNGGVLELVHVYVVEPDGSVIDIMGRRTLNAMRRDLAGPDWEACPCEDLTDERLLDLIEDSGNLAPFDDDEVAEAIEVIRRDPVLSAVVRTYQADRREEGDKPEIRPRP